MSLVGAEFRIWWIIEYMKIIMNRIISNIIILLFAQVVLSQSIVTIEAPSPDPTLTVRGPEKNITLFNENSWEQQDNFIALFSSAYGNSISSDRVIYTALQINKDMKVTAIVNGGVDKNTTPSFNERLTLDIPKGGFVLVASDSDYATKGWKKFIAEHFRVGDIVKLRLNGEIRSLAQIVTPQLNIPVPAIEMEDDFLRTVVGSEVTVEGKVSNYDLKAGYKLLLSLGNDIIPLHLKSKGKFSVKLPLSLGTNYFDIQLVKDNKIITEQPLVIYSKEDNSKEQKELVMWVEQFPNALTLINREAVIKMVNDVKKAGFTSIGLDVKGPEGYVSYRKNDLSATPYFTASKNPKKKVEDTGFDLLQVVVEEAHKTGLKVYTSFNFFTEGNITVNDYAILNQHKDWEEIVQRPEDRGKLLKITESTRGKEAAEGKLLALAFVNPSNKEVQDFQLLRVEEVLKNYDVDGIVLDRCRYDNIYADFSHVTRNAFEDYLSAQEKKLENFPADAYKIDINGALVKGKYYKEWITFRSQTIADFTGRIRQLVNSYKEKKNPDLKMAAYVGSWYEVYYQNGVNWASKDFQYDSRLGFPESEIYGAEYNKTSYLKNLDFLMIGTYYKTPKEVNRYITLGNILTCGQCPILGSMSLPDLAISDQGKVFGASLKNSSGLMIFDHCYVDWTTFFEQMRIAFSQKRNNK